MVKPIRILVFLFYIGLMSALILAMSPGKIPLSKNVVIKLPTISDFILSRPADGNVDEFLAIEKKIESQQTKPQPIAEIKPEARDSITAKSILYPKGKEDALFGFFEALSRIQQDKTLIRILHYGDSQLEGDRISEFLRARLQEQFGGCGVGFVAVTEVNNLRSTLQFSAWKYWEKFSVFGNGPKVSPHKKFGLLGNYHTFRLPEGETGYGPWIEYRTTELANSLCRKAEVLKVLVRSPEGEAKIRVSVDGREWVEKQVLKEEDGQKIEFEMSGEKFDKVRLEFDSPHEVQVDGIAFDCRVGVALDNIPMRGSSGTDFTKMSRAYLAQQYKALNVKLIIYQFGVNVVPYMLGDFGFYENAVYAQLKFLQSLAEDLKIDIIVIGTSDMSRKDGEFYRSYPNIVHIRNAQKQAAFRAGCPFWDLYEAMGGENSMVRWVNAKPALAAKDYTHFSSKGARVVAELFYSELIKEYRHYLKLREKQSGFLKFF